jgi:hypothetical protein
VTDEIIESTMHSFNKLLAEKLNISMINIDKEKIVDFKYPQDTMQAYKKEFISDSNHRSLLSMEIVLQELV